MMLDAQTVKLFLVLANYEHTDIHAYIFFDPLSVNSFELEPIRLVSFSVFLPSIHVLCADIMAFGGRFMVPLTTKK